MKNVEKSRGGFGRKTPVLFTVRLNNLTKMLFYVVE